MQILAFPARLPGHALERLSPYDRAAHRKGIQTVTIETELAVQEVNTRLKNILHMPELQVFGGLSNPLAMFFAFETSMSVDEVRAETCAIRQALAAIGIAAMAIIEEGTTNE